MDIINAHKGTAVPNEVTIDKLVYKLIPGRKIDVYSTHQPPITGEVLESRGIFTSIKNSAFPY